MPCKLNIHQHQQIKLPDSNNRSVDALHLLRGNKLRQPRNVKHVHVIMSTQNSGQRPVEKKLQSYENQLRIDIRKHLEWEHG